MDVINSGVSVQGQTASRVILMLNRVGIDVNLRLTRVKMELEVIGVRTFRRNLKERSIP